MRTWILVAVSIAAAGCEPPCAQLCRAMADYAEECGRTVPDAQVDACIDEVDGDGDVCATYSNPDRLRLEWDCDDVNRFQDDVAASMGN